MMTVEAETEFSHALSQRALAPLWEVLHSLVPQQPTSAASAMIWAYKSVRPLMLQAGELITAAQAERRVLMLENPSLTGQGRISSALYAGVQLILPGEYAPPHRHSQSALRF